MKTVICHKEESECLILWNHVINKNKFWLLLKCSEFSPTELQKSVSYISVCGQQSMIVTMTIKVPRVIHRRPERTVHKDAICFSVCFLDRWILHGQSRQSKFYGAFFGGEILNSFIMDSHMKADLNCPRIHLSILGFFFF